VSDRQILMAGGIVGALVGVIGTYLYFTEDGRRWREQAEGSFGSLMQEAERLLSAADQVRQSVAELRGRQNGWPRSA
jgi:type II secretory pathway component PulM